MSDSIHLLVMDLHRVLNGLQAAIATETLEGAAVYRVEGADRLRIQAFMSGVNATAPLKFDHPGLGTTATRSGDALVLQNDIGTTDAHVLVVRVVGTTATVVYTDVHPERADFFCSLLDGWSVSWTRGGARAPGWLTKDASYSMLTGQYEATDVADLDRFLAFLGSRIVFLIDWNRGRRALRKFVRNRDAIELLRWSAAEGVGHRALLQLGGTQLIADALGRAIPGPLPYGKRLDKILGPQATVDSLRALLRITSANLRDGRSKRLIRYEVRSELSRRFHWFEERLPDVLAEHMLIVADLARAAQTGVIEALTQGDQERLSNLARRAQRWEREADTLVESARTGDSKASSRGFYWRLLDTQDNVADALENVVFLSTLVPAVEGVAASKDVLRAQVDLLVRGSCGLVKCIAAATAVKRENADQDSRDFLEAIDEVVTIEHQAEDLDRESVSFLAVHPMSFPQHNVVHQILRSMEAAFGAMSDTALALRDHLAAPGRRDL